MGRSYIKRPSVNIYGQIPDEKTSCHHSSRILPEEWCQAESGATGETNATEHVEDIQWKEIKVDWWATKGPRRRAQNHLLRWDLFYKALISWQNLESEVWKRAGWPSPDLSGISGNLCDGICREGTRANYDSGDGLQRSTLHLILKKAQAAQSKTVCTPHGST